ncbi:phosphatidylglycerophosphatase [[Haemophilus] ducreyi]|nr:phosphatase PAP2 family protein [[Haemophilus] ducreyi]AKO46114.1 phosphatidylglycerophosphatase [[Haemophilus] ducreyi]AKO47457.1 phosphatidylglycerophosphatase [[Haemophilus] ducreyi]AKO48839.1 phosphatidylglycerophosphatase [[Haemophilus] ducreyi]AKO50207.1 phosphatidylglycerophosphatase [[Haemophilus] ducreyi]ANF62641.1 phosphatidylglycerophosphatase [[Haemophilus] ducreyi]
MIKRLSFYTFLMLLIPFITWAINWRWIDDQILHADVDHFLYCLTETGSVPYAAITCVILTLWLIALTRRHYSWILIGTLCVISMFGTQLIKTAAKNVFAEPRPYVQQMMGDKAQAFYQLDRSERAMIVQRYYQQSKYPLIIKHRMHETGYSFPSGHTIFSVSWLLLFSGLLFGIKNRFARVSQIFIVVWSALMLISRLRLGMHFPIDLLASTLIAWLFHIMLFIWLLPYFKKWRLFTNN